MKSNSHKCLSSPCFVLLLAGVAGCGRGDSMRTISAAFRTIYIKDDGTRTTVAEPTPTRSTTAILVPDGSPEGYARFAVTVGAEGELTVPNVPAGRWFLQRDRSSVTVAPRTSPGDLISVNQTQLIPITSSSPDLTTVIAARPDLARVSTPTHVTANISNLEPWLGSPRILVVGAQADVYEVILRGPGRGDTSASLDIDWSWPSASWRSFDKWRAMLASTRFACWMGSPQPSRCHSSRHRRRGTSTST